jgi:hypothetical protein
MKKVEYQEQKKLLLRQIGKYATAAGAVLLTGNLANASVHLTTTTINLTPGYHGIDIDGDGTDEFTISVWMNANNAGADISSISSVATMSVIHHGAFTPGHDGDPAAFPLNQIIGPTLANGSSSWTSTSSDTIVLTTSGSLDDSSGADGNFGYYPGQTRYLGVRYTKSGETHYGWIGIHVNNFSPSNPLYDQANVGQVIDFAYESTPDTPINAGGGSAVPVLPIVSALGLGLAGLFGFVRNRRKKAIVE